jgi:hypothetical protein
MEAVLSLTVRVRWNILRYHVRSVVREENTPRDTRVESRLLSCFSVDGLATLFVLNLETTIVLADV